MESESIETEFRSLGAFQKRFANYGNEGQTFKENDVCQNLTHRGHQALTSAHGSRTNESRPMRFITTFRPKACLLFFGFGLLITPPAPAATLLYKWRLDGNVDATAGALPLTVAAGAPLGYTASKPSILAGTQSASFSDELLTGTLSLLDTSASAAYSVSVWINNSDMTSSTFENLFNFGTAWNGSSLTGVSLRLDGSVLQWGQNVGFTETYINVNRSSLANNTWYNLVAIRNGAASALYVNGVLGGTGSITAATDNVARFGPRNGSQPGNQYTGLMADIQIFQGALNSTEALSLYQAGAVPEPTSSGLLLGGLILAAFSRRRVR